jgi:hypothetical protein
MIEHTQKGATSMTRSILKSLASTLALTFACAVPALAGGFGIQVQLPDRNDPRQKDAFLVVRPIGCHGPGASVTATAEGIVNGKRKSGSLPLTLIAKGSDKDPCDTYLLKRPALPEGTWALAISATSVDKIRTGVIVELTPDGKVRMVPKASVKDGKTIAVSSDGKTRVFAWTAGGGGKEVIAQYFVDGNLKDGVEAVLKTAVERTARSAQAPGSTR